MAALLAELPVQYSTPNPANAVVILALVAMAIVLLVFARARRGRVSGERGAGIFNRARFRRMAGERGFDAEQMGTLETLVRKYQPPNPYAIFDNPASLDALVRKALAEVEWQGGGSQGRESRRLALLRLRQALNRNGRAPSASRSGEAAARDITLIGPHSTQYRCRIIEVQGTRLSVEIPTDYAQQQVRWSPGTGVTISLRTSGGKGLSLPSVVLGYHEVRGRECLVLGRRTAGT